MCHFGTGLCLANGSSMVKKGAAFAASVSNCFSWFLVMFFFGVHVCSHCLLKKTMKLLCWIWLWTLFHVGLQKAQAGKSSSSKRKRESSQSEDWNTFSMNLHAKNVLPATVAKRNIEKANKAGAQGKKFRAKKGKANAARCMFNACPNCIGQRCP